MYDGVKAWREVTNEKLSLEIKYALLIHCQGAQDLPVDD